MELFFIYKLYRNLIFKTEGVSVTISGGLNVGIPNVVGDDSSLGVNVSVQQQTNKSWTYGTSDSKTVTNENWTNPDSTR